MDNSEIRVLELTEHNSERYERIAAHMPVNGSMGNKVLKLILERFTKPDSKLNIVTDSSLVHTYPIVNNVYDDHISERYAVIGETSSYHEIERIHMMLAGHITSVCLENFNRYTKNNACISMMNIKADLGMDVPEFRFMCHGEERTCSLLRQCVEFGSAVNFMRIMRRLLEKFPRLGLKISAEKWSSMLRYPYFIPAPQKTYCRNRKSALSESYTDGMKTWFIGPLYDLKNPDIVTEEMMTAGNTANNLLGEEMPEAHEPETQFIHATIKELENYKHNCSTTVMKYIGIMLACVNARTNMYMDIVPFVADRTYTDDELRNKAGLSDDEMEEIRTVVSEAKTKKTMVENMEFGVPDSVFGNSSHISGTLF